ncbi:MAG: hypothetical protein R2855_14010 [Thermomicrobiales bacterium]
MLLLADLPLEVTVGIETQEGVRLAGIAVVAGVHAAAMYGLSDHLKGMP